MKYMMLIHQGDTPTPRSPEAWATLSEEEQQQVFADYQATNQTQSGNPPVPVVQVVRGGSCGDGPNTENTCRTAQFETPCLVNSCSFITVQTQGFVENYRCEVANGSGVLNPNSGNPGWLNQNYPGGYRTNWYAPGGSTTVTCTDSTGYQTNSSTVTWEIKND